LQGEKSENSIELAAQLTAYYSDAGKKKAKIKYGKEKLDKSLKPTQILEAEVEKLKIKWK